VRLRCTFCRNPEPVFLSSLCHSSGWEALSASGGPERAPWCTPGAPLLLTTGGGAVGRKEKSVRGHEVSPSFYFYCSVFWTSPPCGASFSCPYRPNKWSRGWGKEENRGKGDALALQGGGWELRCTLFPAPSPLHPLPCTLFPAPFPAPSSLHLLPAPSSLHCREEGGNLGAEEAAGLHPRKGRAVLCPTGEGRRGGAGCSALT